MPQAETSLAGIPLLSTLEPARRERLERICAWRRLARGEVVFDRGSGGTDVFFVVDGVVQIFSFNDAGREVLFSTLTGGEFFGELAAIDGLPRSADARAREASLLAVMPAAEFRALLLEHAEIANQVLERVVRLVRACDDRIMTLSTLSAVQRVYAALLDMARPDAAGAGLWIVRPLPPMREIAASIGTSRETVARAIGQLRQSEVVRRKDRNLYILDRDRLEALLSAQQ